MTNAPDLVTAGGAVALQPVAVTRKTPRRLFWDRFRQDKAALGGGIVIIVLIFLAIFGGPIAAHITGHPQNTTYNNMTDAYGVPLGPNRQFWFGADAAGRDLFVRTMYGARTSLFVGIVASGLAVLIGTDRRPDGRLLRAAGSTRASPGSQTCCSPFRRS